MATNAVPMKPRREMQERKAPELVQFTKPGQILEGLLISIEPVEVKGKQAIEYLFQDDRNQRMTCLGTADLNKKINPGDVGHWVRIRYESDDSSFQKQGQSAMKVFNVGVSKDKEAEF